jgi:hypothetical protein
MSEAADVLAGVSDRLVVIGAVALEAALAGKDARSAATTDIDCAVEIRSAALVIAHLEQKGMRPSDVPHEKGFTWVRDGLRVQLLRPPAPVRSPPVSRLVINTNLSLAERYHEPIAFEASPRERRLLVVRPAALLALKAHAFGRTRHDGGLVQRDYHDAFLLIEHCGAGIAAEYSSRGDGQLNGLIRRAIAELQTEAVRQVVREQITRIEPSVSERAADARLARAIRMLERRVQ